MADQRSTAVDGSPRDDRPANGPDERPADGPDDKPDERPADKPHDSPDDRPHDSPDDRPDDETQGDRTPLGAAAWGALLRVHATVVPMLDRELQAARRLPLAWYDVLLELNSAPGRRLRMSDLGEQVTLSRTRVSRLVDELGAAGLVTREANPDDRRSAYAVLTARGRTALRGAAPVYLGGIRRHFADILSPEELRIITAALDRVIGQARASGRPGSGPRVPRGLSDGTDTGPG